MSLLWTDWLILGMLTTVIGFALYASRHPHLKAPWLALLRKPVAVASLVYLLAFVLIGLSDSIRWQTEQGSQTLLDWAVSEVFLGDETTYSAPLATHSFSKQTRIDTQGHSSRTFPRLKFGGAHLQNPLRDWQADVLIRGVVGALLGALTLALLLLPSFLMRRSAVANQRDCLLSIPAWRALWISAGLLAMGVGATLVLSGGYHVMGTDKVGQDVLVQALKSVRTGLVIGSVTSLVLLPIAMLLGTAAGFFRGWVDDLVQYVYTVLNSIPSVLLIAAAVLALQVVIDGNPLWFDSVEARADARLLALCVILGMTSWTELARLLRAETLKLREMEYVQAARALGRGRWQILAQHILPNVMHVVLITVVLQFSGLVLAEAVLSYVGVGVDPSMASWGNMINAARLEMGREPVVWWALVAAFAFMFTLVLAANLFADAVRDVFDPRLQG